MKKQRAPASEQLPRQAMEQNGLSHNELVKRLTARQQAVTRFSRLSPRRNNLNFTAAYTMPYLVNFILLQ